MLIPAFAKRALRARYKPGRFYRIPFGRNAGAYIEYDESINLDMMLGLHEPHLFALAREILRPGMAVVDIGANRGYFAAYFGSLVGHTGAVFAFEPMPDNFAALRRAIVKNRSTSVIAIQKAVAGSDKTVTLFAGANHLMSSLDSQWAGEEHGQLVEAVSLDAFFQSAERGPDFIKMDIEGGGVYALPGMENVIKRFKPCLYLESHTAAEDRAIGHALSLLDFAVYRVGSNVPVRNIHADYRDPYGIHGTIVAIPRERADMAHVPPDVVRRWRFGQRMSSVI